MGNVEHQDKVDRREKVKPAPPESVFGFDTEPFGHAHSPLNKLRDGAVSLFEQRRLFLILPFGLMAGIWGWFISPNEPSTYVWLVIAALCWAAALYLRSRIFFLSALTLAGTVAAGFTLMNIHRDMFGTRMLDRVLYVDLTARLSEIISIENGEQRLIFDELELETGSPDFHIEQLDGIKRIRIFARSAEVLVLDETVSFSARLYPVPKPVTAFGYDGQVQSFFDGIGAYGTLTGNGFTHVAAPEGRHVLDWAHHILRLFDNLRLQIAQQIERHVPSPASGILTALTVGNQSGIDDVTRDQMSRSGLAHVLAISGLHLTLVAGGVFAAIRLALALGPQHVMNFKRVAAVGGLLSALFYLGLSGASISAIRATIMLALVFVAVIFGRQALTLRNVAIAALFVLLVDPSSMLRPSFQLSFAAVAALVSVYEYVTSRQRLIKGQPKPLLWRYFWGLFATSLIAGIATAPFAAYHFQSVAPLGALANLVVMPLVGFLILPSAFLGVVSMPIGLDPIFWTSAAFGIDLMLDVARYVSSLPLSRVQPIQFTPIALTFVSAGLLGLVVLRNVWRFSVPLVCVFLAFVFGTQQVPDILISDSTQAIAIRAEDRFRLVSGRVGSFTTYVWEETFGLPIEQGAGDLPCDQLGCIVQSARSGLQISIISSEDAFAEDCGLADLIVTRLYAPGWCAADVIDASDLNAHGVHEVRIGGDQLFVRPVVANLNRMFRP